MKPWDRSHRGKCRQYNYKYFAKVKAEVLAHYGAGSSLRCCWDGCDVTDIDILSLDHVNDDGAEHRKEKNNTGFHLYIKLKKSGYPPGYQTLCHNHQWKKQILRLRTERLPASSATLRTWQKQNPPVQRMQRLGAEIK